MNFSPPSSRPTVHSRCLEVPSSSSSNSVPEIPGSDQFHVTAHNTQTSTQCTHVHYTMSPRVATTNKSQSVEE